MILKFEHDFYLLKLLLNVTKPLNDSHYQWLQYKSTILPLVLDYPINKSVIPKLTLTFLFHSHLHLAEREELLLPSLN